MSKISEHIMHMRVATQEIDKLTKELEFERGKVIYGDKLIDEYKTEIDRIKEENFRLRKALTEIANCPEYHPCWCNRTAEEALDERM